MLDYMQVTISSFVQQAKNAKDSSKVNKSIYQARVTYTSIVTDSVRFLKSIKHP
jgi:hypothetical protein